MILHLLFTTNIGYWCWIIPNDQPSLIIVVDGSYPVLPACCQLSVIDLVSAYCILSSTQFHTTIKPLDITNPYYFPCKSPVTHCHWHSEAPATPARPWPANDTRGAFQAATTPSGASPADFADSEGNPGFLGHDVPWGSPNGSKPHPLKLLRPFGSSHILTS